MALNTYTASQRPAREAEGIAMNARHHEADYNQMAASYLRTYEVYSDGNARLVELAGLQPGESVLDVGCGPGVTGILAARVLGKADDVFFVDTAARMIDAARASVHGAGLTVPLGHFVTADVRRRDDRARLLGSTRPGGFDVVMAKLFVNHFTEETKPALLRALLDLCAPAGRVVFDYGAPAPSLDVDGRPGDEMLFGLRYLRRPSAGARVRLEMPLHLPPTLRLYRMVGDPENGRRAQALRDLTLAAGGTVVRARDSYDLGGAIDLTGELERDTRVAPSAGGVLKRRDLARRWLVTDVEQRRRVLASPGAGPLLENRVFFSLDVVLRRSTGSTPTKKAGGGGKKKATDRSQGGNLST